MNTQQINIKRLKDLIEKDSTYLVKAIEKKEMPLFTFKGKGINCNIIGVRQYDGDKPTKAGYFDDLLINLYETSKGVWNVECIHATTDAGKYYMLNPLKKAGTIIICEGYHQGAFSLCGKGYASQNEYGIKGHGSDRRQALRLMRPIWTIRDNSRDLLLDYLSVIDVKRDELINKGILAKRKSNTNIHGTKGYMDWLSVNTKASAGCQVAPRKVFEEWLETIKVSEKTFGNSFSYKLIRSTDII
jgi:hypothetical protein